MNCIFNQRAKDRPRSYDVIRRCMDSPALWTSPCWHVISGHSKNIIVSAAHCLRRHKMYNSNVALFAKSIVIAAMSVSVVTTHLTCRSTVQ